MTTLDILGYAAGFISSITFLPQVLKTAKDRDVKSISLPMFLLVAFGVILWLIYGIMLKNAPIIITNTCVLIMSGIMIFFKLKYEER